MMKKTLCLLFMLALLLALPFSVSAATEGSEVSGSSPDLLLAFFISLGLGLVISLVIVLLMKRSMSTVRSAKRADGYVKQDSFSLTEARDIFLYSTVTRVRVNNDRK